MTIQVTADVAALVERHGLEAVASALAAEVEHDAAMSGSGRLATAAAMIREAVAALRDVDPDDEQPIRARCATGCADLLAARPSRLLARGWVRLGDAWLCGRCVRGGAERWAS